MSLSRFRAPASSLGQVVARALVDALGELERFANAEPERPRVVEAFTVMEQIRERARYYEGAGSFVAYVTDGAHADLELAARSRFFGRGFMEWDPRASIAWYPDAPGLWRAVVTIAPKGVE